MASDTFTNDKKCPSCGGTNLQFKGSEFDYNCLDCQFMQRMSRLIFIGTEENLERFKKSMLYCHVAKQANKI